MRLIDADAELKEAKELSGPQTGDGWDNWGVYALIKRQPTIDAVPVVRCKDCRFYRFYDGTFGKGWICFENNTARHGDDFCSRGERKDDADE